MANWKFLGTNSPPEILSNKVVLTPPAPGNERGAIWSQKTLEHQYWTVDVDFRATGVERGGGNFQIWYVKNGQSSIGMRSIYTAGKFDGLALVVDQYAGTAGFVRGFLNDGTTDFNTHHSVDSIAFGHCNYPYRNLGRPSRITMQQSVSGFKVTVDGNLCFESSKIKLPPGNELGITAASAETPDSFEVFKLVTTTDSHNPEAKQESSSPAASGEQPPAAQPGGGEIPAASDPPEAPASQFETSSSQFADLHNRLQSMMRHIISSNGASVRWHADTTDSIDRLSDRVSESLSRMESSVAELHKLRDHLGILQEDVRQTKKELHSIIDGSVNVLKDQVERTHHSLQGHVWRASDNGLGLWGVVAVVAASNVVLAVAYVLYKRRTNNTHMKYL